jgi:hypothetical protein
VKNFKSIKVPEFWNYGKSGIVKNLNTEILEIFQIAIMNTESGLVVFG